MPCGNGKTQQACRRPHSIWPKGRTGRELQEQAKAGGWVKLGEGGPDRGFGWLECDEKHLDMSTT